MHVVASPMHFNAMQKVLSIVRSVPRETSANRRTIDLDRRSSMTPRSTEPIALSVPTFPQYIRIENSERVLSRFNFLVENFLIC